jgi:hypothetical protein
MLKEGMSPASMEALRKGREEFQEVSPAGVVVVFSHKDKDGDLRIALLQHKEKQKKVYNTEIEYKIQEGSWGLLSETFKKGELHDAENGHLPKGIHNAIRRGCVNEMDIETITIPADPDAELLHAVLPFRFTDHRNGQSLDLPAYVVNVPVAEESWLTHKTIDTKEIMGAKFFSLDEVLTNPSGHVFRENTPEILAKLQSLGYFK